MFQSCRSCCGKRTCASKGVLRVHSTTAAVSPAAMLSNMVGGRPLLMMRVAMNQKTERWSYSERNERKWRALTCERGGDD
jgi:hypothetical protein